jgi:hypothetical protein
MKTVQNSSTVSLRKGETSAWGKPGTPVPGGYKYGTCVANGTITCGYGSYEALTEEYRPALSSERAPHNKKPQISTRMFMEEKEKLVVVPRW